MRRILRGLEVPAGGFEELLAKLDRLRDVKPSAAKRAYLRERLPMVTGRKAKGRRAA